MLHSTRFLTRMALAALALGAPAVHALDDGLGRDWRALPPTKGLTWTAVAAVCPRDGVSPCAGSIGSVSLTDWVWATEPQVRELLARYAPIMATEDVAVGISYAFAASNFIADFGATQSFFGGTYGGGSEWTGGWMATTDDAGLPRAAGASFGWTPVSIDGGFGIGSIANPNESGPRAVFLFQPTGAVDGLVHANNDSGQVLSPAGGTPVASVLDNDFVAGAQATPINGVLTQLSSTDENLNLSVTNGSVEASSGIAPGTHTLDYQLCDASDLSNCDVATVTVTVRPYLIDAVNDTGVTSPSTGGSAIPNVLVNDMLGTARPTPATVTISLVGTAPAGLSLDTTDGSVDVAKGAALGTLSLTYRICERANPTNCDQAVATVTVRRNSIDAVNDSARGSSKVANTPIASVLNNDWFNGARATTALVKITQVTASPKYVTLNTNTGAVRVTRKTDSGTYSFQYRICEIADPTNCDTATVTLDLSGSGGD